MILRNMFQANNNHAPINNIRIGIWGAVGAGKTIFLTMLFECLEDSDNWLIDCDDRARDFLNTNKKILDNEGKPGYLPRETDPAMNQLEIFRYTITSQSKTFGNITIILEFIDAAGGFYENPYGNLKVSDGETTYEGIIEYLMSCHGIIFLLDPLRTLNTKTTNTYRQLLSDLFMEFRRRSRGNINQAVTRLEQYMAFCVTKADEEVALVNGKIIKKHDLSEDEYAKLEEDQKDWLWKTGQDPDKLVTAIIGENMRKKLSNEYVFIIENPKKRDNPHPKNRCNFYPISAFGRYKDKQGKLCTVFEYPQPQTINNNPDPEEEQQNVWGGVWGGNIGNNSNPPQSKPPMGIGIQVEEENNNLDPNKPFIKPDVPINPINILAPLEWLITGIRKHPPELINHQQNPSSVN